MRLRATENIRGTGEGSIATTVPVLPTGCKRSSLRDVSLSAYMSESLAPLVDLVFPPRCPLCGDAIGEQTGLCLSCWNGLAIPGHPCCDLCQVPLPTVSTGATVICPSCLAEPPLHGGIAAGTLYNEPSRKLVLAFKHGNRIALAPFMAGLIVARLPALEGDWMVVPVPLFRWRLWRRGYNQAALLAREIARRTGHPLMVDALVRTRRTPSLGGLGRNERKKVLARAIAANPGSAAAITGRNVILVDDVLTSGATSSACVRELKKAGAEKVVIACFARVVEHGVQNGHMPKSETPGVQDPGRPRDDMF